MQVQCCTCLLVWGVTRCCRCAGQLTPSHTRTHAVIVRSRNSDELDKCHTVVDVGAVYDPKTRRFDHHQRSFTDTMSELGFDIKLSSAGLVYRLVGPCRCCMGRGGVGADLLLEQALWKGCSATAGARAYSHSA